MVCQECGKRPATLHFTKIVNGEKTEFHFCETCAKEKGDLIPGTANGFSIHNLLSGFLNFDPATSSVQPEHQRCEECGLTYAQFSKLGRFGCSSCYKYFSNRLDPLLKRVHGSTAHTGKIPKRGGAKLGIRRQVEQLKEELQHTIEREEFEQAAKIRDRIRELEGKIGS